MSWLGRSEDGQGHFRRGRFIAQFNRHIDAHLVRFHIPHLGAHAHAFLQIHGRDGHGQTADKTGMKGMVGNGPAVHRALAAGAHPFHGKGMATVADGAGIMADLAAIGTALPSIEGQA